MTTLASEFRQIMALPGVMPAADRTAFATKHYTEAKAIRFRNGLPEKIGGWQGYLFQGGDTINGTCRSMYSDNLSNAATQSIIGSHTRLYSLIGQSLVNITPLQTSTTAIANSLATQYDTLANNPITTASGSSTVTIADTQASRLVAGDLVRLSGATAVGGILAGALNTTHIVRSVGVNSYTINVGTAASSAATGGGAGVVRATGLVNVSAAAHGQANGDRVKITAATAFGGITAPQMNLEFIIRNVATNTFDVMTAGFATSSVTAAGGAGTLYQKQIPAGQLDESFGLGYGMGLYGVGLYGVSKLSSAGRLYPRIWFFDRYAANFIATAGNQTSVYSWDGDTTEAPVLVTNAPTNINYAFVSNSILVTFGAGGVNNKIKTSDQGDITIWTASSANQVYEDLIEGAGRLTSHASVAGTNLIFTDTQTYLFSYIGLPNVWSIQLLEPSIGIIAPLARIVVKGVAYWMGQQNFYRYHGGNAEIIPANSQIQSTILNYVMNDLNSSQKSKIFCWYNEKYDEIWWHYPSQSSLEPDRVARLALQDLSWTPDDISRTAAEAPFNPYGNPFLLNGGLLYRHEIGSDDDTAPLSFNLTTNLQTIGKPNTIVTGFVPDSRQTGNISVRIIGYQFPQTSGGASFDRSYTVTPTTERVSVQNSARVIQYNWSGEELGQEWHMGAWLEYIQPGAPN